ncbi:MAG: hypothetical protein H7Y00_03535 [Fimbriimonadaceae bacterium]|nr:hypothetical protein [Chitinophagales bacterium]
MKEYKLDRTYFKMQTAEEAANNYEYWKKQSLAERLKAAFYLNSIAYNFDINDPPKIDRNYFTIRSRK